MKKTVFLTLRQKGELLQMLNDDNVAKIVLGELDRLEDIIRQYESYLEMIANAKIPNSPNKEYFNNSKK